MMKISEVTRHLHFAWSLPVRGIAMATGDSSLCRVSTVTDLLSFISVARATQPRLIDGISALPQQRGWEVGLLSIDFQPLQTPASPSLPPAHKHTQTLTHTHYPYVPPHTLFLTAAPVHGATIQYVHTSVTSPACRHTLTERVQVHTNTPSHQMYTYVLMHTRYNLMTVSNAAQPR